MTTGELIKKYRKEKGLTIRELAEKIGRTESSVQKYELGLIEIPISIIQRIADTLEIPFEILLDIKPTVIPGKTLEDFTTEELLAEISRRIEKIGR